MTEVEFCAKYGVTPREAQIMADVLKFIENNQSLSLGLHRFA